jgi:hypothetical protein
MAHMSMFSALIPVNVYMFDTKILELVNFEIIPTDAIFEKLNIDSIDELD